MPDKYHIKVNEPPPSEVEIAQHKNFNRVLAQYRRSKKSSPLHDSVARLNKHIPVIVLMLVLAMLIVYFAQLSKRRPELPSKPHAPATWRFPPHALPGRAAPFLMTNSHSASWIGAGGCYSGKNGR